MNARFRTFVETGGKFRVSVTNACNLRCFFCHNEGMASTRGPGRGPGVPVRPVQLDVDDLLGIINAFTGLGGRQLNITGGEPLLYPRIVELLAGIERRECSVLLNTNAVDVSVLLERPVFEAIGAIYASLHTMDDQRFREHLGPGSARQVTDNVLALRAHGYNVITTSSIGDYNAADFPAIVDFVRRSSIPSKSITLIRGSDQPGYYGADDWFDPGGLGGQLRAAGWQQGATIDAMGGRRTEWRSGEATHSVKNVGQGRLRTDLCDGCPHEGSCGEGVYGVRVGVDGIWKPCLLRSDAYLPVRRDQSYEAQILEVIDRMIGDWERARYVTGSPA